MLVAYFDESGTNGDSELITVAGLLGDTIEWARLEYAWNKRLGKIPYSHATECAVQDGPCRGLTRDESIALSADLSRIIASCRLLGVGGAVYRQDWAYAASALMKAQFKDPYHFCFAMVVQQVCNAVKNTRPANEWPLYLLSRMNIGHTLKKL